jgi:hypothetical protein
MTSMPDSATAVTSIALPRHDFRLPLLLSLAVTVTALALGLAAPFEHATPAVAKHVQQPPVTLLSRN